MRLSARSPAFRTMCCNAPVTPEQEEKRREYSREYARNHQDYYNAKQRNAAGGERRKTMLQLPDAPWIREAENNGYPVGNGYADDEDEDEDDDY